jgi:hypothetical protein
LGFFNDDDIVAIPAKIILLFFEYICKKDS